MQLRRTVLEPGVVTNGVDRRPALALVVDSRCQCKQNQLLNVLKRYIANQMNVFPGHVESPRVQCVRECTQRCSSQTRWGVEERSRANRGRAQHPEETATPQPRRNDIRISRRALVVERDVMQPKRHENRWKLRCWGAWKLPANELYIERWAAMSMLSCDQTTDGSERLRAAIHRGRCNRSCADKVRL